MTERHAIPGLCGACAVAAFHAYPLHVTFPDEDEVSVPYEEIPGLLEAMASGERPVMPVRAPMDVLPMRPVALIEGTAVCHVHVRDWAPPPRTGKRGW